MPKLPDLTIDPTLAAVDAALEAASAQEQRRPYFGMSQAGGECARQLWLRLRWALAETFPARTLKAFADGHAGEALQAERLRLVRGVTLHTHDEAGEQFGLEALGGHMRGHLDGVIVGLLQSPKTAHVWEHKQVNPDKFKALQKAITDKGEKDALEAWDGVYFAQAQLYMKHAHLTRHYLTVSTPGGRETISVRTEYQADKATALVERAEKIVFAEQPPERISTDATFYLCKWCSFHSLCHDTAAPAVSCRTCAHATPERDGTWTCAHNDCDVIPIEFQRVGCDDHRYIPRLVENFAELENDEDGVTTWRNKLTGAYFKQPDYLSREFVAAADKRLLGDDGVQRFKDVFGDARIIASPKPKAPYQRAEDDKFSDIPWIDQVGDPTAEAA
jgi:hypothetical protein